MNGAISVAGVDSMVSFGVEVIFVDVSEHENEFPIPGARRGSADDLASWAAEIPKDAFVVVFDAEGTDRASDLLVDLAAMDLGAHYLVGGGRAYHLAHASQPA